MKRCYLKLHLWLKTKCERLTLRQRRIFLFSVSTVYFICSAGLIVSVFIPGKERSKSEQTDKTKRNIPELIDTPVRKDSLYQYDHFKQPIT